MFNTSVAAEEVLMSIYPFLKKASFEELVDYFKGPPADGKPYAYLYYEEVAFALSRHGQMGVEFLLNHLKYSNRFQVRGILFGISVSNSKELSSTIRETLQHYMMASNKMPLVKAAAIDGLRQLHESNYLGEILKLTSHKSSHVRASALRYISHINREIAIPKLMQGLSDKHYIVRETAIDELDDLDEISAIDSIKLLIHDHNPAVRQAANTAVKNLST
jgi:HEAT repeat protein